MTKNYIPLILLLLATRFSLAQTVIAKQSFEALGDTWMPLQFSTDPCTSGGDTWNYRSSLRTLLPSDGNQFWGIEDLYGDCGSSDFESIQFPEVDLSLFHDVELSFEINVVNFNSTDRINYLLILDNQPQEEVELFVPDGYFNTNGWQKVSLKIPNKTQKLRLHIRVRQNGNEQYAGIDNVLVTGTDIAPCSKLLISEYAEGTSSTNHRNNYLEIYNPSNEGVNLSNFDLVIFRNENTEPGATLALNGILPAYSTFLIEDGTENLHIQANLSTTSAVMDFTGNDKIALRQNQQVIDLIGQIGESLVFAENVTLRRKSFISHPTSEYNAAEWDIYGLETIGDLNKQQSACQGPIPEIELTGNQMNIPDGQASVSAQNNTYLGMTLPDRSIEKSFLITNTGIADLILSELTLVQGTSINFTVSNMPKSVISPAESTSFTITFQSDIPGPHAAEVIIQNNDSSENPFNFKILAEVSGPGNGPLLISQYYQGAGNNKWIEITNTSTIRTPANTYYLALFRDDLAMDPFGKRPSVKTNIPALEPGQNAVYRASLNVTEPAYAINQNELISTVCSFTGNDILVISTKDAETCWENRTDIIGSANQWSEQQCFVRKYGCEEVGPKTYFDPNDWLVFPVEQVNQAQIGFNLRIGQHFTGPAVFEHGAWQNGIPDLYRHALIKDNYNTGTRGNLDCCSMTIDSEKTVSINKNGYLAIQKDLTVNGALHIENEASLLMHENDGRIVLQGILNIHKNTEPLKMYDYTYWSSPVTGAVLPDVFKESPQNSFFRFNTNEFNDNNKDNYDDDDPQAWLNTSGTMVPGMGYTAMASAKLPFQEIQTVVFSGSPNNGSIEIPVHTSSKDTIGNNNWNFIGNPYPSAIDLELLLQNPRNKDLLSGAFYFWTHHSPKTGNKYSSDDYATYVVGTGGIKAHPDGKIPSKYLSSCQGLFVNTLKNGTVILDNSMRAIEPENNFFKTDKPVKKGEEKDRIWLNLSNEQGVFKQILIGFFEDAGPDYDSNFDAVSLQTSAYTSFYSLAAGNRYTIQGTNTIKEEQKIALGLRSDIAEATNLRISIDHFEGVLKEKDVLLLDKLNNKTHDLKEGAYDFSIDKKGIFDDRFVLHITGQKNPFDREVSENMDGNLLVSEDADSFEFISKNGRDILSVKIFDMLGRTILESHVNEKGIRVKKEKLVNGVLISQIILDDFTVINKKLLLYK